MAEKFVPLKGDQLALVESLERQISELQRELEEARKSSIAMQRAAHANAIQGESYAKRDEAAAYKRQVAALEAKLAEQTARVRELEQTKVFADTFLNNRLREAESRLSELVSAVEKRFEWHDRTCQFVIERRPCDCGKDALAAAVQKAKERP